MNTLRYKPGYQEVLDRLRGLYARRGLQAILLLDDRGFPPAFDVIAELKARAGDVPVALFAPYKKFVERLARHDLPGGVIYQVLGVPDLLPRTD